MRKRLLAYFLCVCMVLTLLPCTAFAAVTTPTDGHGYCGTSTGTNDRRKNVHWTVEKIADGNWVLTIGGDPVTYKENVSNNKMADYDESEGKQAPWYVYRDKITKIVIDTDTITGNKGSVSSIGDFAFSEFGALKTVELKESVTTIGDYAFQHCTSLEVINLPDSLTEIGVGAFMGCENLKTVNFTLPGNTLDKTDKFTTIPEKAFANCTNLTTLLFDNHPATEPNISDTVKVIGEDAFANCKHLGENAKKELSGMTFSAVTTVSNNAFRGSGLPSIKLPRVSKLGTGVFSNCDHLTTAYLGEKVAENPSPNNTFKEIPDDTFYKCISLTDLQYPNTVQKIGKRAFAYSGLLKLAIPWTVTEIDDNAYAGIGDKDMGATVYFYPYGDHYSGKEQTRTYHNNIFQGSILEKACFQECTGKIPAGLLDKATVKEVYIASTITDIDPDAFNECTGVTKYEVGAGMPGMQSTSYRNDTFGVLYTYDGMTLVRFPDAAAHKIYNIPATVEDKGTRIGIANNAFLNCTNLTEITFDRQITDNANITIGKNAFKNCTALAKVNLNDRVTDIQESAFEGDKNLTGITLSEVVNSIGKASFKGCGTAVTKGTGYGGFEVELAGSALTVIPEEAFMNSNIPEIVFPSGMKTIGVSAFEGCGKLKNANLNAWLNTISDKAFKDCIWLEEVTFHKSDLNHIGESAFEGCIALMGEPFIVKVNNVDTEKHILQIPATIKDGNLGDKAFKGCKAITQVEILGKVDVGEYAFEDCTSLEKVVLHETIDTIGNGAFKNDILLKDIALPYNLNPRVSRELFYGCKALKSIVIPNGVDTIENNAFAYSGLTEISMGPNVQRIKGSRSLHETEAPSGAFYMAKDFKTIKFYGEEGDWAVAIEDPSISLENGQLDIKYLGKDAKPDYPDPDDETKPPYDVGRYFVQFDLGDGSSWNASDYASVPHKGNDVATLKAEQIPDPYLSGYTFEGWSILKDGSGKLYSNEDLTAYQLYNDVVFYAVWKKIPPKTNTVTIEGDGTVTKVSEDEVRAIAYAFSSNGRGSDTFVSDSPAAEILRQSAVAASGSPSSQLDAEVGDLIKLEITVGGSERFIEWIIEPSNVKFLEGYDEKDRVTYFYMPDAPVTARAHTQVISTPTTGNGYSKYTGIVRGIGSYTQANIESTLEAGFGSSYVTQLYQIVKDDETDTSTIDVTLNYPNGTNKNTHTFSAYYFDNGSRKNLPVKATSAGLEVEVSDWITAICVGAKANPNSDSSGGSGYTKTNSITTDIGTYSASTIASTLRAGFSSSYITQLYQIIKTDPNNTSLISVPLSYPSGTNSTNYDFYAYAFNNGSRRSISVTPTSGSLLVEVSAANTAICVGARRKSSTSDNNDSSSGTTYKITDDSGKGGSIKVASSAEARDSVTIRVTPKDGYELKDLVVYDKNNKEIAVKERSEDRYTFTMPSKNVTVEATFQEIDDNNSSSSTSKNTNQTLMTASQLFGPGVTGVAGIPDVVSGTNGTTDTGTVPTGTTVVNAAIPFTDVANNSEYRTAVGYVYSKGLMAGTNDTTFSPDTTVSRAMVVSILHRLEGSPTAEKADFEDVEENEWYETPIAWASSNGIVSGYTGDDANKFGPTDPVTKEQLVSILARYALLKKYDTVARADISEYKDADQVTSYALGAMQWGAGKELFTANALNLLAPQKELNRAETADMLMRFCQNVAKIQ